MEKEFIPYDQALILKELGFDELCIARFDGGGFRMLPAYAPLKNSDIKEAWFCVAPLYQQAFRFLRDKYYLASSIQSKYNKWTGKVNHRFSYGINKPDFLSFGESINYWEKINDYETFDDAQYECLIYLIDLVKKENQ